jgi:hypothetical protein
MEPLEPMKAILYPELPSDAFDADGELAKPGIVALDIDTLIEEDLIFWLNEAGCSVLKIAHQHWSVTRADGCVVSISGLDRLSLYTSNAQQVRRLEKTPVSDPITRVGG